MKRPLLLLFFIVSGFLSAQIEYHEFDSQRIGQKRQLKIQLPTNYDADIEQHFPLIVVLDGDYLFEPVAGSVYYHSYWEDMPNAIVVGIDQNDTRNADVFHEDINFLPTGSGLAFYEFVANELIPWLELNYRILNFRVIVGHDQTANFLNYYLLVKPPIFQGYISMSPDLTPFMHGRLEKVLGETKDKLYYYQATSKNDIAALHKPIFDLNESLKAINNSNLNYFFDDFEDATHYSLAARAIPKSLEKIFSVYSPISKMEYTDVILKKEDSPYEYLVEKYKTIEEFYAIKMNVRVNDLIAISSACTDKKDWKSLQKLGKLANDQYPTYMLGEYYIAQSLEMKGEPKKALRTYEKAYLLEEKGNVNKDIILNRMNKIKEDFGY